MLRKVSRLKLISLLGTKIQRTKTVPGLSGNSFGVRFDFFLYTKVPRKK